MPKITRATQKIFAQNGTDQLAAFGSMKTGTPIYTDNIEDLQTSDYEDGWEQAIVADEAPFLEEMNGVQYVFSKQLAYLFQQGIAEWDAGTTYYTNSFCQVDGKLYYSKQDGNINHSPADDTADEYWTEFKPYTEDSGGSTGSGFQLFDLVTKDHVLSFEESKGFAQLGTYVYKEAVPGSRYGYPDFYAKCIAEKTAGTETQTLLGETTITTYNNSNGHIFYDIADKATVDTYFESTGEAWYYGIDTTNERIFLPRTTRFQYTSDTSKVGEYQEAGLPNIEGNIYYSIDALSGAFKSGEQGTTNGVPPSGNFPQTAFDASASNPIYGNSDTVTPAATNMLLYMVVGNTEVESAATDITDITTTENDTIPLFAPWYFDFEPNSVAWLKAGQQANSGSVYTTAYNTLVNELTTPTLGLKVIDVDDMVADTDYSLYWKVDQTSQTFTTPVRTEERILVATKKATEEDPTWYNWYSDGWLEQGGLSVYVSNNETVDLPKNFADTNYYVQLTYADDRVSNGAISYINETTGSFDIKRWSTIDVSWQASGYGSIPQPADYTEPQLYFKVSNAVQNLQVINVGEITTALADKIGRTECKSYITETYNNGESWYRVYSDGWCEQGGLSNQSGSSRVINFPKPYNNYGYYVAMTVKDGANRTCAYSSSGTDSFTAKVSDSKLWFQWQAFGYITQGE